jgi:N-methylhydantoinase A
MKKALKGERRVNFDELGFHQAAIYERDALPAGVALKGPLVIEEPAATTVVFPDQRVTRDKYGFLHIEMADAKPARKPVHKSARKPAKQITRTRRANR